jgi:hypothetical protein
MGVLQYTEYLQCVYLYVCSSNAVYQSCTCCTSKYYMCVDGECISFEWALTIGEQRSALGTEDISVRHHHIVASDQVALTDENL